MRALTIALLLMVLVPSPAGAQQPKLEMHRAGVSVGDGSGWYLGESTKGSFSVRLPVPFHDFTIHDSATGAATHVVGGKSPEGVKFAAVEALLSAATARLDDIPKSFASNPSNRVSDIVRGPLDGSDMLSFAVEGPNTGGYFRYVRTKERMYMLSIEYPKAYRELAAANKDKFFASFELKRR
ncbi:hypothetical protein [Bradyrhizobium sp. NP1]|uniref:hypothetical protein n=1 Tax=Bradyrhizobium sp. NP1 TaxID=3049772 RepID=UPI0025A67804|nr:hypothetical protein [Bradyrhizobium sp. NP1]WJR75724.1 hypothetical protein QOU61_23410 [Bradyrhizobium sp. NP1]